MKKKYFEIGDSIESRIIGREYPQCFTFQKGFNGEAKGSFYETCTFFRQNIYPPFVPNLDGLKLSRRAKITDSLSNSILGMPLINHRTLTIFKLLNFCEHRIYPAIIYGKSMLQYYFIYPIDCISEHIIWNKCRFEMKHNKREIELPVTNTKEEYNKFRMTLGNGTMLIDTLALDFDVQLDFFILKNMGVPLSYFVSERFIDVIDKNNITGFSIERTLTLITH